MTRKKERERLLFMLKVPSHVYTESTTIAEFNGEKKLYHHHYRALLKSAGFFYHQHQLRRVRNKFVDIYAMHRSASILVCVSSQNRVREIYF